MALKALLLRKQIDNKKKVLKALRAKDAEFATREAELTQAIEEVENDEQRAEVQELVDAFTADKESHDKEAADLRAEIEGLENDLKAEEEAQNTEPPAGAQTPADEITRGANTVMNRAAEKFFKRFSESERAAFVAREDVQAYLGEVRAAIKEKRAITNVGLTIPEVMLGLLRENITDYSKLYRHVTVRNINGDGVLLIQATVGEAIWTDCCANLNELSFGYNDLELFCFRVGGFYSICNANIEDSDLNLAAEVMTALGQGIGLALDKAILYGRNAATTMKMPQGIVSRLAQTEAPSGYPATARPWADLHTSNIITIASTTKAVELFKAIVTASGAMKGKYSRGEKVWVMNEATHTALIAEAMSINAAGAVASGVTNTMPVVGGTIEELSFLPDNVIIAGYFDNYILAERAGQKFASSEHVRFLQDQTVYKGTARYDGAPAIAEAFVAIGINGVTPDATMTFPTDTANA